MINNQEGVVIVWGQVLANGEYLQSHENEANVLEGSSPADERMINRGNVPTNSWETWNRGIWLSSRPVRKRVPRSDAIAQAFNHMKSAIDKAYTSESVKVSLGEIFAYLLTFEGLGESDCLLL